MQLAASPPGRRPLAPDVLRRGRVPHLAPPPRRRLRQLGPPQARDGRGRPGRIPPPGLQETARVQPEAETGRQRRRPPALLHVLDHLRADPHPVGHHGRVRHGPHRRRPLQEGERGKNANEEEKSQTSFAMIDQES